MCLKLPILAALLMIFPMECFPLLSSPVLPLLPFPTGVKVGYPMSPFSSGIISIESLLELDDDKNEIKNALKEDVSGPSRMSKLCSESLSFSELSWTSSTSGRCEVSRSETGLRMTVVRSDTRCAALLPRDGRYPIAPPYATARAPRPACAAAKFGRRRERELVRLLW
uniref:Secreted protein n=1 Tax=Arundo donax TaxID=35708 RepID=A0A0A9DT03_ARUDO